MSKVFLINVGANTSHSGTARSPIFKDDTFRYVSFPHLGQPGARPYPPSAYLFTRNVDPLHTHLDPDWDSLTYGDNCRNPRAIALRRAKVSDTLLFWALLWRNTGRKWEDFTGERGWYLVGVLRISEILEAGQASREAKPANAQRAAKNVHFSQGILGTDERVFIGSPSYSTLFPKAVDLGVTKTSGLLFETMRTAAGLRLELHGKRNWKSSTRACRAIWDLDDPHERERARVVREAVLRKTGFDIFRDL